MPDPRPEDRRKQLRHGAQSDQGDKPMKEGKDEEPVVYQGPEESNQQRRY